MARIGEARKHRGDLGRVVADEDRRRLHVEARRTERGDQDRPGGIVSLPRRGTVRAGHDDRLMRGGLDRGLGGEVTRNRTDSIAMSRWSAFAMS